MMSSPIKLIKPCVLNDESISSWFSLRNHKSVQPNSNIPGLNLGLNTEEDKEIILQNRKLLLDEIGLDAHKIAYAVQVHKTKIEVVKLGGTYPNTDAFVTTENDLALAIQVADCAAVLFGDPKNRVIAAAHAGWRGAAGNIIPKTLKKMMSLGAEVNNIKAFISPCISNKNFEVGEEVAVQFPDEFVDREHYNKPHLDLKEFIRYQLLEQGMIESKIELSTHCTINDEQFYSYRRQKEGSGRMMGIIKLTKA
ncbi:MAG: peptidoglycan editing factor PgeF [Gracilimonas sp.]|uniref:peptidoglycan editing factor PgeF n=1 Tax=Gracilimonas sp. TaxID=1974203 RepID=UPI003751D02A|nr:peptidoglycan editing factor PgeF [Gracilimonas sp.]